MDLPQFSYMSISVFSTHLWLLLWFLFPRPGAEKWKPEEHNVISDSAGWGNEIALFTQERPETQREESVVQREEYIKKTVRQKERCPTWISCQLEWEKAEEAFAARRVASMKTCQWSSNKLLNGTNSAKRKAPFYLSLSVCLTGSRSVSLSHDWFNNGQTRTQQRAPGRKLFQNMVDTNHR